MKYYALATDYDGTLARDGKVNQKTIKALERLRASGRQLIMVTGRELDDLATVFQKFDLFDRIVAENGALLYTPRTHTERILGEPPPDRFVSLLREQGVHPMSVGRSIVATWRPHEVTVLECIRELGLELQVIFNKEAVMVLPSGVNKATGLRAALEELKLSAHNVAGIGDAENDHAFLSYCECAVAVDNALPMLKERADIVTRHHHGAGVSELIERLLTTDLSELEGQLTRHHVLLGWKEDGETVKIQPHGQSILIAGTSGAGKSTLATGLLERLSDLGYQFCIVDPEGDYATFERAIVLGDAHRPPEADEVCKVLEHPEQSVSVNMIGVALEHRPAFFENLMPHLEKLRRKRGRPHWLVLDETHHLLPTTWDLSNTPLSRDLSGYMFITVHPEHVSKAILSAADLIIAIGRSPGKTLRKFSQALGVSPPSAPNHSLPAGEGVAWFRRTEYEPFWFRSQPPRTERRRHYRKYAEGELEPEKSFYFRGPKGKLRLRAQNLMIFLQMADGVDDDTWMHHLMRGEYSRWLRNALNDEALAAQVEEIERQSAIGPAESRARIRARIEERYTAPA